MENHLAMELEAMMKKAQSLFRTERCCIYKVPHSIRQLNEDAYTPVLVSIGPLHHGNPRLVTMEARKQFYCQHFIERSEASLTDLVSCVQQLEPQIRACYSAKIDLTADELVKVIFIDCCFIIEFFLQDEWIKNDVILSNPWMTNRAMYDLLLLENQVPFFVFEKIYNLAFASPLRNGGGFHSFMHLAVRYFSHDHNKQGLSPPAASSTVHFTDLLRYFYLPPFDTRPSRVPRVLALGHGASELVEAGVKFKVNEASSSQVCMLALEFKDNTLRIPHIEVGDETEIWLRNIVALEQCHYPQEHYIIDYVRFLGHLMNTNKDAGVLIKAGIIDSFDLVDGGNNQSSVAKLFNDVRKNIVVRSTNADYLRICNAMNAYYNNRPWKIQVASLRRDYCPTQSKTTDVLAGLMMLYLAIIQTVFTIISRKV